MKNVIVLLVLVAACGDDGGSSPIDASTEPDAILCGSTCNPFSQTGCAADEKCTWQQITETEGVVACVPDGTVALGDVCTIMDPGETAGYDDCVGGTFCRGVCKEICVDAPDSCPDMQAACAVYVGVFDGECVDVTYGLCEPI
jgi:hypothetical protein